MWYWEATFSAGIGIHASKHGIISAMPGEIPNIFYQHVTETVLVPETSPSS
jgi:hypothetical protein